MMSEFTKGEWLIESNGAGVTYIRSEAGNCIATVHTMGDGKRNAELEIESAANVPLIATSKDMYEALIKAKESLEGLPHSLGYEFTHLPEINAVLAKARGESQ